MVNTRLVGWIRLDPITEDLLEVSIFSESAESVLRKTIDLLKENHEVEPVLYQVFVRSQKFEEDKSELHLFGEYVFNLYQSKNHRSKFNLSKIRVKPFSKFGEEYFKDMRLIDATKINSDNIFKYKENIFKNRKLKYYNISFKETVPGSQDILIECINKKDGSKYVLQIDRKSFGIKKFISRSKSGGNKKEITFKEIEGKFYLDYSKLEFQSFYSPTVVTQTEAVYNIIDVKNYDRKLYKGYTNIVGEPIKRYRGNWSDTFWEDYNYLSIPAWTKDLMWEEKPGK